MPLKPIKCRDCKKPIPSPNKRQQRCRSCYEIHRGGTPETRFFRYVQKTPTCWLWVGAKNGNGYGCLTINSNMVASHRFSWELHFGAIPKGMFVCHHCDNPLCVNPEHLFIGTHTDNMRDALKKNRLRTFRKLTEEKIREIREMYLRWKKGFTEDAIAKKYGVSQSTVDLIIRRKTWTHI